MDGNSGATHGDRIENRIEKKTMPIAMASATQIARAMAEERSTRTEIERYGSAAAATRVGGLSGVCNIATTMRV
ncbi:hypothetical protein [Sorangium sp. So ce887]|uniref:hypothetical protein n=1 Tax=Sorangium sp. So ce887 TaxID=3133324 RepID=UPI003F623BFC